MCFSCVFIEQPNYRAKGSLWRTPISSQGTAQMRRPLLTVAAPLLAIIVVPLLAPQRNELVVDVCAGRGRSCGEALSSHLHNHTVVHIGGQHRGGTNGARVKYRRCSVRLYQGIRDVGRRLVPVARQRCYDNSVVLPRHTKQPQIVSRNVP